jgi:hypothetical protein
LLSINALFSALIYDNDLERDAYFPCNDLDSEAYFPCGDFDSDSDAFESSESEYIDDSEDTGSEMDDSVCKDLEDLGNGYECKYLITHCLMSHPG